MGFSIITNHLPCLRDYNAADGWERGTKPIRGRAIKPLGDRRKQHMSIERRNEGTDKEAVACVLYNTDCVTYYKDGRIHLNHGNYITQSTAQFIDRVFPYGAVSVRGEYMMLRHGGGTYQIPAEGLWVGPGTTIQNIQPFQVRTIKRAAAKVVRGKYAAFKQYTTAMCKLLDGMVEGVRLFGRVPDAQLPDLSVGEDLEVWYPAAKALMVASSDTHYVGNSTWIRKTTPERIARKLDSMILREHRDEVFEVTTLPDGEYKKDSNAKYFR